MTDRELQRFRATGRHAMRLRGSVSRPAGDFLASHDLEDIITVVDGRPELSKEVREASPQLREYLVAGHSSMFGPKPHVSRLPLAAIAATLAA
jgi:hypothetical protein